MKIAARKKWLKWQIGNVQNGIQSCAERRQAMRHFLIILTLSVHGLCNSQTFSELQSGFEQNRLKMYKNHVSKMEQYSFTNDKDSSLFSFEIYDSVGNVISARQYSYKSEKYYSEQFYNYDSLGRRTACIRTDTYADKLNNSELKTIETYTYKGGSLTSIAVESYNGDNLTSVREIPERPKTEIDYLKKELDSSGRLVMFEYHSVAGLEKTEITYHKNGKIKSTICTINGAIWYKVNFSEMGDREEYIEWLYDSNSSKPVIHSITHYDNRQMITRIDYLNKRGKIKSFIKYYYFRYS